MTNDFDSPPASSRGMKPPTPSLLALGRIKASRPLPNGRLTPTGREMEAGF
ncbi:MAG: hypothetical protein V7K95_17255 [Nostoc sp.]